MVILIRLLLKIIFYIIVALLSMGAWFWVLVLPLVFLAAVVGYAMYGGKKEDKKGKKEKSDSEKGKPNDVEKK